MREQADGAEPPSSRPAPAALRDLARGGIAVASSIHAPSPDTFALFDRVLILQRGRAVYFGENGEGEARCGETSRSFGCAAGSGHTTLQSFYALHIFNGRQPIRLPSLLPCRRGVQPLLFGAVPGAAPHATLGGHRRLHVGAGGGGQWAELSSLSRLLQALYHLKPNKMYVF